MRVMKKSRLRLKTEGNKSNHDISQNGVERKNDFPTVALAESKEPSAIGELHGNESRTGSGEHARS